MIKNKTPLLNSGHLQKNKRKNKTENLNNFIVLTYYVKKNIEQDSGRTRNCEKIKYSII